MASLTAVSVTKTRLTRQKVFPLPTVGAPSASNSLSALSAQALKLQVFFNPVMVGGKEVRKECLVSDSRDCTSHWLISDTGLVDLIKKGCQPIISASSWAIEVQENQPTLVVERYTVLTKQLDRIGWPEPIKSQFFNLNLIGGFSKLHI